MSNDNGARLGWLIDLETRQVEIYRSGRNVEVLQSLASLSGGRCATWICP